MARFNETRDKLREWNLGKISDIEITQKLLTLEDEIIFESNKLSRKGAKIFEKPQIIQLPYDVEKIRQSCGLPPISEDMRTQPLFGLYTYRKPSEEEINDAEKFKEYLQECEMNKVNCKLLKITKCIAYYKFFYNEEFNRRRRHQLRKYIDKLERIRDIIIRSKTIPTPKIEESEVKLKPYDIKTGRPLVTNVAKST